MRYQNQKLLNKYLRISLLALAFIVSILVVFVLGKDVDLPLVLGLTLLAVGAIPFILDSNKDLLKPVNLFVFWFVISIGIRGIVNLYSTENTWLRLYDPTSESYRNVMSLVFLYSITGLICLYIGYYAKIGDRIAKLLPRIDIFSNLKPKILSICFLYFIIGILATLLFIRKIGWLSSAKTPADIIAEGLPKGGRLYYSPFMEFITVGFLMLYIHTHGRRRRLSEKLLMVAFLAVPLFTWMIGGFKGVILRFFVYFAVIYHYLRKHLTVGKCLFVFFIILFLIPALNSYRAGGGVRHLDSVFANYLETYKNPSVYYNIFAGRSAGADHFFLIIDKTPEIYDFQWGQTLLRIATSFIPRPLWPQKPFSFGVDYARIYLGDTTGLSVVGPSIIGELYINFHLIGIFLFFFIGIFLKTIYSYCIKTDYFKEGILLYCVFAERLIVLVDGPIVDYCVFLLISFFPIAFAIFISKVTSALRLEKAKS